MTRGYSNQWFVLDSANRVRASESSFTRAADVALLLGETVIQSCYVSPMRCRLRDGVWVGEAPQEIA